MLLPDPVLRHAACSNLLASFLIMCPVYSCSRRFTLDVDDVCNEVSRRVHAPCPMATGELGVTGPQQLRPSRSGSVVEPAVHEARRYLIEEARGHGGTPRTLRGDVRQNEPLLRTCHCYVQQPPLLLERRPGRPADREFLFNQPYHEDVWPLEALCAVHLQQSRAGGAALAWVWTSGASAGRSRGRVVLGPSAESRGV